MLGSVPGGTERGVFETARQAVRQRSRRSWGDSQRGHGAGASARRKELPAIGARAICHLDGKQQQLDVDQSRQAGEPNETGQTSKADFISLPFLHLSSQDWSANCFLRSPPSSRQHRQYRFCMSAFVHVLLAACWIPTDLKGRLWPESAWRSWVATCGTRAVIRIVSRNALIVARQLNHLRSTLHRPAGDGQDHSNTSSNDRGVPRRGSAISG